MALAQDVRERLTLPAFAAPMFLCSSVELATESCKAGIIGSLTRNHCRDLAELESQLQAVSAALARNAADAALPANPAGPGRFRLIRRCRLLIGSRPNHVGSASAEAKSAAVAATRNTQTGS